jgi:hypothetical protein
MKFPETSRGRPVDAFSLSGLEGLEEITGAYVSVVGSKYGNADDWVREPCRLVALEFETRDWLRMCLDFREWRVRELFDSCLDNGRDLLESWRDIGRVCRWWCSLDWLVMRDLVRVS